MPSAKISAGTPNISMMSAVMAPTPNNAYATGCWLMNPWTSAFMMEAWGDGSTARRSPGAASPNW